MVFNLKYIVYATKLCPKCEQLKSVLKARGAHFDVVDMASPEALTELRVNGVFTLTAPVLQKGDEFYTVDDLFDGEIIRDIENILLAKI